MARKISTKELGEYEYIGSKPASYFTQKDKLVFSALKNWVENSLKSKKIAHGDIMPSKADLARLFGVSTGTIQSAMRFAEDLGYFESKQRIGTVVRDKKKNPNLGTKMFSKKDVVIQKLKKTISKCKINSFLPSARKIAFKLEISHNTVRVALKILEKEGYIKQKLIKGNEICWLVTKNTPDIEYDNLTKKTIPLKAVEDIKKYITENFKVNDKIPKIEDFARMLNISTRSVNDAMKILNKEGIVLSRRGSYGTIYICPPDKALQKNEKGEKTKFMSGAKNKNEERILYNWEKAYRDLQKYIFNNYETGDKIPTIIELSKILKTDTNSIKKAIRKLCKINVLVTTRGKTGGTYINDLSELESKDKYTWLAISKE